jgi:hypothetical protein
VIDSTEEPILIAGTLDEVSGEPLRPLSASESTTDTMGSVDSELSVTATGSEKRPSPTPTPPLPMPILRDGRGRRRSSYDGSATPTSLARMRGALSSRRLGAPALPTPTPTKSDNFEEQEQEQASLISLIQVASRKSTCDK